MFRRGIVPSLSCKLQEFPDQLTVIRMYAQFYALVPTSFAEVFQSVEGCYNYLGI